MEAPVVCHSDFLPTAAQPFATKKRYGAACPSRVLRVQSCTIIRHSEEQSYEESRVSGLKAEAYRTRFFASLRMT